MSIPRTTDPLHPTLEMKILDTVTETIFSSGSSIGNFNIRAIPASALETHSQRGSQTTPGRLLLALVPKNSTAENRWAEGPRWSYRGRALEPLTQAGILTIAHANEFESLLQDGLFPRIATHAARNSLAQCVSDLRGNEFRSPNGTLQATVQSPLFPRIVPANGTDADGFTVPIMPLQFGLCNTMSPTGTLGALPLSQQRAPRRANTLSGSSVSSQSRFHRALRQPQFGQMDSQLLPNSQQSSSEVRQMSSDGQVQAPASAVPLPAEDDLNDLWGSFTTDIQNPQLSGHMWAQTHTDAVAGSSQPPPMNTTPWTESSHDNYAQNITPGYDPSMTDMYGRSGPLAFSFPSNTSDPGVSSTRGNPSMEQILAATTRAIANATLEGDTLHISPANYKRDRFLDSTPEFRTNLRKVRAAQQPYRLTLVLLDTAELISKGWSADDLWCLKPPSTSAVTPLLKLVSRKHNLEDYEQLVRATVSKIRELGQNQTTTEIASSMKGQVFEYGSLRFLVGPPMVVKAWEKKEPPESNYMTAMSLYLTYKGWDMNKALEMDSPKSEPGLMRDAMGWDKKTGSSGQTGHTINMGTLFQQGWPPTAQQPPEGQSLPMAGIFSGPSPLDQMLDSPGLQSYGSLSWSLPSAYSQYGARMTHHDSGASTSDAVPGYQPGPSGSDVNFLPDEDGSGGYTFVQTEESSALPQVTEVPVSKTIGVKMEEVPTEIPSDVAQPHPEAAVSERFEEVDPPLALHTDETYASSASMRGVGGSGEVPLLPPIAVKAESRSDAGFSESPESNEDEDQLPEE